ncbi:helix-turn-helix domain-containing protein [Maribacter confluentis]|uniref:Helix-turn-helix domain-containing protein n=1 Tax=Maribacter confluentis TaxID=1656093 RepID=A0ABT8RLB2_9FLAO|nr:MULTISPECIES: helix-turn-helix domain-containing protein [Maribacter]MDO1511094.1 helix-turn-helix domain-containing protein [Maribacter confluentis]TVZ14304.1 HxlR family transcriptional regulator [Maribacter sp. MAR_2009_72]
MEIEHKKRLIKYNDKMFSCTTSIAMELIGGKWKSVILIYLLNGKKRYNELYKLISTITERTLSLQLKKLEEDGLITRHVYTKKPPLKVEYQLTPFGESLAPVLTSIAEWGKIVAAEKGEVIE